MNRTGNTFASVLCLFCLCLSAPCSLLGQTAPTTAQKIAILSRRNKEPTLLRYLHSRVEWAKLHEADGDLLLKRGDAPGALAAYQKAMAAVGAGGYWLGWKVERAAGGQRVLEVAPGTRAALAGVQVGDLLVSMDGIQLGGLDGEILDVLLYCLDGVPVRPQKFVIRRGEALLELSIYRRPTLSDLMDQGDRTYREALEQKLLRLILQAGLEPEVNDNMRWAAKDVQRALREAKGAEATEDARDNVRGAAYAFPGWADYYLNCGLLLEAAGDATQAEQCYRNFLTMRPGAPQAAAVAARFTTLGPLVRNEENLRAWEGGWVVLERGKRLDYGYLFERNGKLITSKNFHGDILIHGAINDEFSASVSRTFTTKGLGDTANARLINKCFGGKLEGAGTMRLSQDKKTLTITWDNDLNIDPTNCAIVSQTPSTTVYVR